MSDFALCRTCPEVTTGRIDSSKGFLLAESSNHHFCDIKPLTNPGDLPGPIRNAILRLGAGLHVSDSDITMLKLALYLEDEWTPSLSTAPAAASTSPTSTAPALESVASMRSRPALTPTSVTAAKPTDEHQLTLFGGVA